MAINKNRHLYADLLSANINANILFSKVMNNYDAIFLHMPNFTISPSLAEILVMYEVYKKKCKVVFGGQRWHSLLISYTVLENIWDIFMVGCVVQVFEGLMNKARVCVCVCVASFHLAYFFLL